MHPSQLPIHPSPIGPRDCDARQVDGRPRAWARPASERGTPRGRSTWQPASTPVFSKSLFRRGSSRRRPLRGRLPPSSVGWPPVAVDGVRARFALIDR